MFRNLKISESLDRKALKRSWQSRKLLKTSRPLIGNPKDSKVPTLKLSLKSPKASGKEHEHRKEFKTPDDHQEAREIHLKIIEP